MNAEAWISAAHEAARTALHATGELGADPVRRNVHPDPQYPWASFEVHGTGDVLWVAQIDGSAPEGTFVATTEVGDMGVWRHPNDPALPGLRTAVTSGALDSILAAIVPTVDTDVVDMITLQPLQRATLRIGRPDDAVYVKVVPPWRAERVVDNHRRARSGGVPAPDVLTVDTELGLIVLSALPGRTFAEHLEEGLPVPTAREVCDLIEEIADSVITHGDLHDRQILLDENGHITGVVDFDDAGDGELIDDLARLLAHIGMRAASHPEMSDRVDRVTRNLANEFSRFVARDDLDDRVDVFTDRLTQLRQWESR